ncbi:MAG: Gfo/Idh/MocA family oxidoreductase [Planctomycetota bacterium]|nr:Gfo/Idh/MocA family oxidoreductase [Planctomycetota bacterium]
MAADGRWKTSRRDLLKHAATAAAAAATFSIVPRHVLGGAANVPPSEMINGALIGCGGRGGGTFKGLGDNVRQIISCDVKFVGKADDKSYYTDFRKVLERKDLDVVAIATPPHWHALISIAAMEAGKDVLCEKPATRVIAEGRALVEAERRYNRIYQVGTFGRYGAVKSDKSRLTHKIMRSGLLKPCQAVHLKKGGLKVAEWSGMVKAPPQAIPANLDWDMYCGPSPLRPYHPHRTGGTHRGYWDYEGGGMADMGQHHFDPVQWIYGKDDTSPVTIESYAPPAHQECCAMWGWVELTYADGFTIVMESTEWGEPYSRKKERDVNLSDLSDADQKKLAAMPDPEGFPTFPEAVKSRKKTGGHAEAAHRAAAIMHLSNIAIRMGRKINYDPVKEVIVGDAEANRLVCQPMRAPWCL